MHGALIQRFVAGADGMLLNHINMTITEAIPSLYVSSNTLLVMVVNLYNSNTFFLVSISSRLLLVLVSVSAIRVLATWNSGRAIIDDFTRYIWQRRIRKV